jgi:hypothetical protein
MMCLHIISKGISLNISRLITFIFVRLICCISERDIKRYHLSQNWLDFQFFTDKKHVIYNKDNISKLSRRFVGFI